MVNDSSNGAGRSCPLHYRYAPQAMAGAASHRCDVLYVVGGLYGNVPALERIEALFAAERGSKRMVFNGDFNWFNTDPTHFERINRAVLAHTAVRGNVETELRVSDGANAGCGCAYPAWVGDAVVQWSNQIMQCLRKTAQGFPDIVDQLEALPMWLRVDVGGQRVAIVHGDAESLAGWGFAQEALDDPVQQARVAELSLRAQVDLFASSHTCLPVFFRGAKHAAGVTPIVLNNGAAGMPNFSATGFGVITRIATSPYPGPERVFGLRHAGLYLDALAVHWDTAQWHQQFLAQWPESSAAHQSYWSRIQNGPHYQMNQAVRDVCTQ